MPALRTGNRFLNHVMQAVLRRDLPLSAPNPNAADIYYEEVRLHSAQDPILGPYVMPMVTLRTNPCRWSVNAGCVMCGYHLGAHRGVVTDRHLIAQTEDAVRRLNPSVYPALVFTSNGSFLDSGEVSDAVRPELLRRLRAAGFRLLVVETRPEYITRERLRTMAEAFSGPRSNGRVPISISFGLESRNDFVQRYCINKGRRLQDYLDAFALLNEEGFSYDCYVLLGKPFMTAREDVADAIETIRFAVDQGAEYCFVMVTNLVDFGLTGYLHERGRYQLPSLWRAVELLEQLPASYRRAVQIKGISHAPVSPRRYAQTCEQCTEHVKGSINFWNQTGEFEHIRAIHPCGCRDTFRRNEWGRVESQALPERVLDAYRLLAQELGVDQRKLPTQALLNASWHD